MYIHMEQIYIGFGLAIFVYSGEVWFGYVTLGQIKL
jgi:hypothetical protein